MRRLKFSVLSASVALAAVAALALVIGLMGRGSALADEDIPTSGELTGTGADLIIECKWELPDMSPDTAGMTYVAGIPPRYDDTPSVLPTGNPCDPVNQPAADDLRHNMMGIRPNKGDDPIERQYEKWVAIESTNIGDIVDVFWKVWEPYVADPPNGPNCADPMTFPDDSGDPANPDETQYCFKYQHHATDSLGPPTTVPNNPLRMYSDSKGNCGQLQGGALTKMFTAAVETGQMTQDAVNDIIARCFQREKAIFRVLETISKDQPSGEYRVEVTAVNAGGETSTNVNFFDVLGFVHIDLDFTKVEWGPMSNNSATWLSGDFDFTTSTKPTVTNLGNDPMFVDVHFQPLVLEGDETKKITRFDLKFRADWQTDPSSLTTVDPIYASEWFCFEEHPVGSNDFGKLDLSVHPENAQEGDYDGAVDVVGWDECPD